MGPRRAAVPTPAQSYDAKWAVRDGYFEVVPKAGTLLTRESFGDVQLHIEWASPAEVVGRSQGRGNSGVIIMGRYEVQVLDAFDNRTYADGMAASLYGQYPPLVNAARKPGEWQTYDIVFEAPRFEGDQARHAGVSHRHLERRRRAQPQGSDGPMQHRQVGTYTAHAAGAAADAAGPRQSGAVPKRLGASLEGLRRQIDDEARRRARGHGEEQGLQDSARARA